MRGSNLISFLIILYVLLSIQKQNWYLHFLSKRVALLKYFLMQGFYDGQVIASSPAMYSNSCVGFVYSPIRGAAACFSFGFHSGFTDTSPQAELGARGPKISKK